MLIAARVAGMEEASQPLEVELRTPLQAMEVAMVVAHHTPLPKVEDTEAVMAVALPMLIR
jgi:hypothetical protein